jgi:hypothetical protein
MRFFVPFILAASAFAVVACVHEDRRPTNPTLSNESRAPVTPTGPAQYLIADPGSPGTKTVLLQLHGGAQGIVVDKRRVIVTHGEPRLAADTTPDPISGAVKLPNRFGGGFLFWTESAIYRSEAFDSALIPVALTPDGIESISFGPKAMMVRTHNGERYGIGLPKGERVPLIPLGLVDVVALDEGRALSFDDRGSVFTSTDQGAHWSDVTAQVKGKPSRVFIADDELWLEDENNAAMRLEPDGHLSWFQAVPPDPVVELRPKDPRWRGAEPPLRTAVRQGVALDDSTAIVIDSGDVVRVDTHTGELVSVIAGKLPPDAICQGMNVPGDVLFACIPRNNQSGPFVVSHTLSGEPTIEQTFGMSQTQFFASDDGGLVFAGPCTGVPTPGANNVPTACVRMPSGNWEERDLSLIATDGGTAPADISVARWVPHADGRVVAVVTDPVTGLYDPLTGTFQSVAEDMRNLTGRGNSGGYYPGRYSAKLRYNRGGAGLLSIIDGTWSFAGTVLHGTSLHGETFDVSEDGKVKVSPYDFEALLTFGQGIGRSKDGRLFQTGDHGATWTEVAAPPTGGDGLQLLMCSSVGCDFGSFYRIGWQLRPPRIDPVTKPANPPPSIRRVRGLELACKTSGAIASKSLPRTDSSPEDLGLGAVRLPVSTEKNEWTYTRSALSRGIVSPNGAGDSGDSESSPALRLVLSGFKADQDDSGNLVASGPNKNVMALRRNVAFVPGFDPSGKIVRTGISIADVVAAAKRAGMTVDEILSSDPTESGLPFPITSADPNGPSDIAIHNSDNGVITVFRGDRPRVAIRPTGGNNPVTISAVALPNDETAFLEFEAGSGVSHVYKNGPNGMSDLFDPAPQFDQYRTANPDALAVGPKSELAILRTPSGSDPPSEYDPAYLVQQGAPPIQLAPWSTVKFADDPACKAEPGGYRAVVQSIGPWVRVSTPEMKVEDAGAIVRVRWTEKRVCLEGFEVKLPSVTQRTPTMGTLVTVTVGTWLVGKGSSFARVGTADGIEWRQPLECTVNATGP